MLKDRARRGAGVCSKGLGPPRQEIRGAAALRQCLGLWSTFTSAEDDVCVYVAQPQSTRELWRSTGVGATWGELLMRGPTRDGQRQAFCSLYSERLSLTLPPDTTWYTLTGGSNVTRRLKH